MVLLTGESSRLQEGQMPNSISMMRTTTAGWTRMSGCNYSVGSVGSNASNNEFGVVARCNNGTAEPASVLVDGTQAVPSDGRGQQFCRTVPRYEGGCTGTLPSSTRGTSA